jgi:hypothetical protein
VRQPISGLLAKSERQVCTVSWILAQNVIEMCYYTFLFHVIYSSLWGNI